MQTVTDDQEQERWYIAVTGRGFPSDFVNRIFECIPRFGLENFITRVSHERVGRKHSQRGEFYLFLGVNSSTKGSIPTNIMSKLQTFCKHLRLRDQGFYLYYDDIKKMASREIEGRNFRQIRMVKSIPQYMDDPFITDYDDSNTPVMRPASEQYEKLLWWLSATGNGSWDLFKHICQTLGLAQDARNAGRIMRHLGLLGYLERYQHGRKWIASPSCLVELERSSDSITYFLAGKRTHTIIQSFSDRMALIERTPMLSAPDRITVTFASEEDARKAIQELWSSGEARIEFAGKAALKLASILPNIENWHTMLIPLPPLVSSAYTFQQWHQQQQNFVTLAHFTQETGFYQLTRITTADYKPEFAAFYDAEKACWFRGDWYGLRFLALTRDEQTMPELRYNSCSEQLAIHQTQRLPDLYERALVLASGLLPARHEQNWHIFKNISLDLAYILADKLTVAMIQTDKG